MLLIKNGTILTLGCECKVLNDHAILIDGNIIKACSPLNLIDTSKVTKVIDAKNSVVMPGLINAHMHFYSSFARGFWKVAPSKNFVEVLENLWWKLDRGLTREMNHLSALVACLEAVEHGTTTIIDHHASPNAITGSLTEIANAVKITGLSSSLCYEVSDRDGIEKALEGIEENIRFSKEAKASDSFHSMMGLHASFTLGDETLKKSVEAANKAKIGFHVHCAEDLADQQHSISTHKMRVVERFSKFGILGEDTILAHAVHLDQKELELVGKSKTNVVINSQSNMNNAVGVSDVFSKIKNRIIVGMGTDAMTNNMLEELRAGMWIQKLNSKNPSVGFMEITDSLFNKNRVIANKFWKIPRGEIAVGALADIIIRDYTPYTPLTRDTVLGHLVFGISQSKVRTTIASGKVLMEDFSHSFKDVEKIAKEARVLAEQLWSRI